MEDGDIVWANRCGVGGFGDGLLDVDGGERGEGSVKEVIVVKDSGEFLGPLVRFMVE